MNSALIIEKHSQHPLHLAADLLRILGSPRIRCSPLQKLDLHLWIVVTDPCFITNHNWFKTFSSDSAHSRKSRVICVLLSMFLYLVWQKFWIELCATLLMPKSIVKMVGIDPNEMLKSLLSSLICQTAINADGFVNSFNHIIIAACWTMLFTLLTFDTQFPSLNLLNTSNTGHCLTSISWW